MTTYVKAIFDFTTTEPGEIPLHVGDIVQILYEVDSNWLYGKLFDHVGSFPNNFVEHLQIPEVEDGQKVFAAIKDFQSDVPGDLSFHKGDVIVGLRSVDQNWWQGSCHSSCGIFPITHVQQLDSPSSNQLQANTLNATKPSNYSISGTDFNVIAKGRAKMDLTAQLEDELSFHNNDVIEITEVIDKDFAVGKLNGKTGSFPLSFVDVIEGSIELASDKDNSKRRSKFDWWKDQGSGTEKNIIPVQTGQSDDKTVCEVTTPSSEDHVINEHASALQSTSGEGSVTGSDVTYGTSLYRENSLELQIQTLERPDSYTQENTFSLGEGGVTPYGKTLFPFVAENPNELTVFDNEIVTLIRHVDDQWIEGEIDGKRGIFPVSYVEIIVDCPYDYRGGDMTISPQQKTGDFVFTKEPLEHYEDTYGCVLYDFHAETPHDLGLREGETIQLLSKIDEEWFRGQNEGGKIGLCPVSFIHVIPVEPISLTSLAKNGYIAASANAEVLQNNNNKLKQSLESSESIDINIQENLIKPPILKPKPSLKPKPQLKPKPSRTPVSNKPDTGVDDQVVFSVDSFCTEPHTNDKSLVEEQPNKERPPRPASGPVFSKNFSIETSLDDVIKNELNSTRKELDYQRQKSQEAAGDISTDSSPNSMHGNHTRSNKSPSNSKEEGCGHAQPPPIPQTKRMPSEGAPKRTPPPRPGAPCLPPRTLALDIAGMDLGPRPVPQRAAPPRPSGKPTPAPRIVKQSPNDLMGFSPEKANGVEFENADSNMEVVQDLERRISQVKADLLSCNENKQMVEQTLAITNNELERTEMKENLEFYSANISGLTQELEELKGVLQDVWPMRVESALDSKAHQEEEMAQQEERRRQAAELRQKHRDKRHKVIDELLQTEKDFLQSLSICFETFWHTDAFKCSGIDTDLLLGNMVEVIEVSQKLLTALENAVNGKEFEDQVIGQCFVELRDEMKRVYAPYCRNHDDVCALLAKYEKEPEVQAVINQMVDAMREKMSVFDLGSVLIKPVQRVLKYPLLLNELIKCTEEDHVDKVCLLEAIHAMTDVAAAINEFKRRKDLVMKYKNSGDAKFSDKMSKLNMHSTKKKLQRFSQKMVGIQVPLKKAYKDCTGKVDAYPYSDFVDHFLDFQTIDDNFTREERKFKNLDSAVRNLVRDVSSYVECVQVTCSYQEQLANDIADYYAEKNNLKDVTQFCQVHNQIASAVYQKFRDEVEICVITPLNRLLTMFQGPTKVIKKRYDKLLDYDNLSSKMRRDGEQLKSDRDSLTMAKNNYMALNAQLLDELPKLYSLSLDVVQQCVCRLVTTQKDFYNNALQQMYHMLGLELVLGNLGDDLTHITEAFNISHTAIVDKLSDISFIPKSFNPRVEECRASFRGRKSSEAKGGSVDVAGSQSDSQKVYLRQQYPADKLYMVVQRVDASQPMDLDLPQGTLLGLIKDGDPMGNKEHWFVDTGATKGFVMKHCLGAAQSVTGAMEVSCTHPVTVAGSAAASTDLTDLLSFSPPRTPALTPQTSPMFADLGLTFEQVMGNSTFYAPLTLDRTLPTCSTKLPEAPTSSQSHCLIQQEFDQYFDDSQSGSGSQSATAKEKSGSGVDTDNTHSSPSGHELIDESYQAVYSFAARTELEVDLFEGETVRVLQKHDLDGNTEWWLVENGKQQGYAPQSYLYKLQ